MLQLGEYEAGGRKETGWKWENGCSSFAGGCALSVFVVVSDNSVINETSRRRFRGESVSCARACVCVL